MVKELIIGLHGKARVGKDTAAGHLWCEHYLQSISFAEPVRNGVKAMFGLEDKDFEGERKEQPLPGVDMSPRELMQKLGGWGRSIHPDFWVRFAAAKLQAARDFNAEYGVRQPGYVFTDVRFENEAAWIRGQVAAVVVVHLKRDDAPAVREDESEAGIEVMPGDVVMPNNGSFEELYKRLDDLVDLLRGDVGVVEVG